MPINKSIQKDSQRLWDLVRYMRSELFTAELITPDEYAALAEDHAAVARLETYDSLRNERDRLKRQNEEIMQRDPIVLVPSRHVPASEFSPMFAQGMLDRMCISFHKYGPVAAAFPEKVDAVRCILLRLARYMGKAALLHAVCGLPGAIGDHNTEWLMDAANFAMIEFMYPRDPRAHFSATPAEESPGRVWAPDEADGSVEVSQRANDMSI
jgi:hypothetical protein